MESRRGRRVTGINQRTCGSRGGCRTSRGTSENSGSCMPSMTWRTSASSSVQPSRGLLTSRLYVITRSGLSAPGERPSDGIMSRVRSAGESRGVSIAWVVETWTQQQSRAHGARSAAFTRSTLIRWLRQSSASRTHRDLGLCGLCGLALVCTAESAASCGDASDGKPAAARAAAARSAVGGSAAVCVPGRPVDNESVMASGWPSWEACDVDKQEGQRRRRKRWQRRKQGMQSSAVR